MPFSPHNGATISQRKIFRFDWVGLIASADGYYDHWILRYTME